MTRTGETRVGADIATMVSADAIDEGYWSTWVRRASAGATATFAGVVRDHDGGRDVVELEYTAHPSAEAMIARAARDITDANPMILSVAVVHRVGRLQIGETALLTAVASAHRRDAFAACEELVERIKASVPIWKLQTYVDGSSDWVNCP